MPSFTEKDISAALQMVADGISVNKAAEAYGINQAQKPQQKLSDMQERRLRDWILVQADLGCPISHQEVREFASKIAVRNGFPEGIGRTNFASVAEDSYIGKIIFLYTYNKAQREAITKSNAIAGFKATGLWPINLVKVLMNPIVTKIPSPAVTANSPAKEQDSSLLKTPQSSIQLRQALKHIPASTTQDPTIKKQNRKITILQRENKENRPKRRKKVIYNGNAKFSKIPAIKKAREHMWRTLQPERTANRVKKLKLDNLYTQFHLNIY
ncbi:Uncharacterized protein HZ326_30020 [Fusarium oxysporum f. sp. albedinis]|nr:Uncharacterized protein HZ326_30020 [Fusarium oxysporum f. sp. albedinis]